MKLLVGFGDLFGELLMATGQSSQRGLGRVFGVAELVSWAESGAGRNHLQGGHVPQLLAQLRRTGDDQGLDLIRGLTSGFDGTGSCHAKRPNRLDPAVA
jgi:hypothetical protein